MKLLSFLLLLHISAQAKTILEKGASEFFTLEKSQDGNEIEVIVKDLQGKALSVEKIQTEQDQFKTYAWQQLQTGDAVKLELTDHELKFKSDEESKTIKLSTKEREKLVLPPLLTDALQKRIRKSPQSKKFEITVIVPDKMLTLDFDFEKKSENADGSEWVLNPDSFFVGLIVGPVTINFDKNLKLKRIKDITLPIRPTQKTQIVFQ